MVYFLGGESIFRKALEEGFSHKKIDFQINKLENLKKEETPSIIILGDSCALTDPFQKVNYSGIDNLSEIISLAQQKEMKVFYFSDYHLFDGSKEGFYNEEDKLNPLSLKGQKHQKEEQIIISNCSQYFIIRTSWLLDHSLESFLYQVIKKIIQKEKIIASNKNYGNPLFVSQLVDFVLFLIQNNSSDFGIYHIGSEDATTWYGLFQFIQNQLLCEEIIDEKIFIDTDNENNPQILNHIFSTSKVKNIFNYRFPLWQDAIAQWLENHIEVLKQESKESKKVLKEEKKKENLSQKAKKTTQKKGRSKNSQNRE